MIPGKRTVVGEAPAMLPGKKDGGEANSNH